MLEKSYDDFYSRNVFWTLKMEVNAIWILYDFRSDVAYITKIGIPISFCFSFVDWFEIVLQQLLLGSSYLLSNLLNKRCSVKKIILEISLNSQKNTCASLIKKETLVQLFSSEICETSKNIFSDRTLQVADSKLILCTLIPRILTL